MVRQRCLAALSLVVLACGGESDDHVADLAARRGDRVALCHVPRRNPENATTLMVAPAAVPAHLAHGDQLGACRRACEPGTSEVCYDGPPGTAGVGVCTAGAQTCSCNGTGHGACIGQLLPGSESCGDGLDNDCDGHVDEGCACAPGTSAVCYGGPAGTAGVGRCAAGAQTCHADGSGYGACVGEVLPAAERCGDGVDDDCDGVVDDGCVCAPGASEACYDGPVGTVGVGACAAGARTCNGEGTGFGDCAGDVLPDVERCGGGGDEDCDGVIDEGCVCDAGAVVACHDGPPGTAGVGICAAGTRTCNETGTGFGDCVGDVGPGPEICGGGLDDDCDGHVDEGCVCVPGASVACYGGAPGTEGVGACRAGRATCSADGAGYGDCVGDVVPAPERCGDGIDADCDGGIDDCLCEPGASSSCYAGPAGTEGVGACRAGTRVCTSDGTTYGACDGEVLPAPETCSDGIDGDCDGVVDEGCACEAGASIACYDGPAATLGIGTCVAGVETCNGTGTGYDDCVGQVGPIDERCGDGLDNDCDGAVDDGCVCAPAATVSCYGGPPGTAGVGACRAGVETCNPDGTGYGPCTGDVLPAVEVCGDGVDDDCDGVIDADDGDPCTDDRCDPITGVSHTPIADCVPDPSTIAPPLDPTRSTSFDESVRFLWTATPPVQRDALPAVFDPARVSVVSGRVIDRAGGPLRGVHVSVARHPEFGHTRTRADGRFDLAFNGGGPVGVRFLHADHLPAERVVDSGWNRFEQLADVALVQLDSQATEVAFGWDPLESTCRHASLSIL